jgi:hypothetical protein
MGHLSRKVRISIRIGTWNIASSASCMHVHAEFLTHQQEHAWVEKEGGRALADTCWEVALCKEMQKLETVEAFSPGCMVMLKPTCMNILTHIIINNG